MEGAIERAPSADHPEHEDGEQEKCAGAMPGVEVAVSEVGEEAGEAGRGADEPHPPGPRLSIPEREDRQPDIQHAQAGERSPERGPIVHHELHDPARGDLTQVGSAHPEIMDVVGEELPRGGEEEGEPAGEEEAPSDHQEEGPAVAQDRFHEAGPVIPHRRRMAYGDRLHDGA